MKNKWLYIGVVAVVIIALVAAFAPRKVNMIDFTYAEDQQVNFGDVAATRNLTQKTVSFFINIDSWAGEAAPFYVVAKSNPGWLVNIGTSSKRIVFIQSATSDGAWASPNNSISLGLNHVAITFDKSSTSNDPVIYINGQAVSVTETSAPSGSFSSDAGADLFIGAFLSAGYSPDGKVTDVRVYNRILSAQEVAELYNARSVTANDNGLVFHATLDGAAGVSNFDGAVLAAANTVVDRIGGAVGVPAGSPVGASDTVMSWGGW